MVGRVLYTQMDMVFLCSRGVARTLISGVPDALRSRAGDERKLLPLDYGRLLLNGGTGNGLPLQVFPDISSPSFRRAVQEDNRWFRSEVQRHRAALEAAHRQAEVQDGFVPIVSGHWRFRNETKEYQYWAKTGKLPRHTDMCSIRHWYYHVHVANPEVFIRGWPRNHPTPLSKMRHYWQCNCEPPDCLPEGWPADRSGRDGSGGSEATASEGRNAGQ